MSSYFVLASLLFPSGVNQVFVTRSAKHALPVTALLWIAAFAVPRLRIRKLQFPVASEDSLSIGDLILLLLPLAPVVQYILNNADILFWYEQLGVFCFFALLAAVPVIVVPALLRKTGSTRPVMYLGLALAFSITNMAALSRQFAWHEWGSLKIQLPIFAGVWLVSWFLFRLTLRNVLHVVIAGYFASSAAVQVLTADRAPSDAELDQADNALFSLVGSRKPVATSSIYLLVYDAYVVSETMSAYGIDNRIQERYLEDSGFEIYPRTYSVGLSSLTSMSRVLNSSMSFYGNERKGVSGDGIVQYLLRQFGYTTYGVFPSVFFFRGVVPSYDFSFPGYASSADLLIAAILEGEFRFDIDVSHSQFIQEKESILSEVSRDPRFIYAHSDLPGHSQNSGACLPNEVELFAERLTRANIEMRLDVEMILENDPEAIVIVAGDHGPYLTKGCFITQGKYDISEISRLDLQDRYGAFLAIRWPSIGLQKYDDITVLQDLFPAVFAFMFADPELLASRVEPITQNRKLMSGALVIDGVIEGGIDDGEPLFVDGIDG